MARLVMVVDVPGADPTRVDPHDVAEDMVELNNDHLTDSSYPAEFVSAEWQDS